MGSTNIQGLFQAASKEERDVAWFERIEKNRRSVFSWHCSVCSVLSVVVSVQCAKCSV